MLLVVSGLPGTGKTTLADSLAGRLRAVRVSVDPVEEALLESGLPRSWESGAAAYRAGAAMAATNLAGGLPVVADAVNDSVAARAATYEAWTGPDHVHLDATAPPTELVDRVLALLRGR